VLNSGVTVLNFLVTMLTVVSKAPLWL